MPTLLVAEDGTEHVFICGFGAGQTRGVGRRLECVGAETPAVDEAG